MKDRQSLSVLKVSDVSILSQEFVVYDCCLTGVVYILHVIKFFQHLSIRAALFLCAFCCLEQWLQPTVQNVPNPHALNENGRLWRDSLRLSGCCPAWGGGYGQMRWDGLRPEQPLAPCFTPIEPPLITDNCCSSWWFHTSSEAGVSSPDDRILARAVNNGGQAVSHAADPPLHITNGSKGAAGY